MRYIQLHHGSQGFQMRVPRTQRAKHGQVVRVNLQTAFGLTVGVRLREPHCACLMTPDGDLRAFDD